MTIGFNYNERYNGRKWRSLIANRFSEIGLNEKSNNNEEDKKYSIKKANQRKTKIWRNSNQKHKVI